MSSRENRRHPRYSTKLIVEIAAQDWNDVLQVATDNVSRGGLFIRSERPVELGTNLLITLKLPNNAELIVEGMVVHAIPPGDERVAAGFGIRFDEKYATDLALLAAMAASNIDGQTIYQIDADYVSMPTVVLDRENESIETTTGHHLVHAALPKPEPAPEAGGYVVDIPEEPIVDRGSLGRDEIVIEVEEPKRRADETLDEDAPIFGIDFGTSFSSIALFGGKGVRVLEDAEGNTMFPSVVCYPEEGPPIVGWDALEQLPFHPSTTFVSPKRLIGRRYDDKRIDPFLGSSPMRTQAGPDDLLLAEVYGRPITIPEVVAEVFRHVAAVGEAACGIPVRRAVVSVPVHYRDERPPIQEAAGLAGLDCVDMVDEPVAAAMAYGLGRDDVIAAVYDFGGGTFDFTLMEVKKGRFNVIRRAGDAWLGGDDFDRALANHAAERFLRRHKVDLRERKVEWQRLLLHCEAAKRKLSFQQSVNLRAGAMVISLEGPIALEETFDRRLLAKLCGSLVDQSLEVVDVCLSFGKVSPEDVDTVVVVGGTCRMPLVRERLGEHFNKEILLPVDPEHIVVVGDAVYARFTTLAEQRRAKEAG